MSAKRVYLPVLLFLITVLSALPLQAAEVRETKVRQIKAGATSVTIEWDDLYTGNGELLSQQVVYGKNISSLTKKSKVLPASVRKYTVTGLNKNSSYYVRVNIRVKLPGGSTTSGYYGIVVNTKSTKPSVAAYDYGKSHKALRVAWKKPAGTNILKYEYQILNNSGKRVKKGTVSSNLLELSSFRYWGQVCRIRVRAFCEYNSENKKWYGPWSSYKALVPQPIVRKDTGKYGIRKDGTLELAWRKVTGARKYTVYISKNSTSGYRKAAVVKASSGKTVRTTIRSFEGEKFRQYTHYYVMIVTSSRYGKSGKIYYTDFYTYLKLI